jgi:hypothetical protein
MHHWPGGNLQMLQWPGGNHMSQWTGGNTYLQMAGGEDLDLPSGPPMAAVPGDGLDSSAFEHGGNDDDTVNGMSLCTVQFSRI